MVNKIYDLSAMSGKRFENVIIQDTMRTIALTHDIAKAHNPDFEIDNLEKIIVLYISDLKLLIDNMSIFIKMKIVNIIEGQLLFCLCKNEWANLKNHIKESLNV